MLHRILMLIALFGFSGCQKISNVVSTVRLDCGAEVDWQESYLKFTDGASRPLVRENLEYVSLEGRSDQLKISSKGCLLLEGSGLWLIRHTDRSEGFIVDLDKPARSSTVLLGDISREELKPVCPAYETGHSLDMRSVLGDTTDHDLRGYTISYSLVSGTSEKVWPVQNFARMEKLALANFFPEGEVLLKMSIVNHFRRAEYGTMGCNLRFDATGPAIKANLALAQPKTFQGRAFLSLSSDQDVRFTTTVDDFTAVDVCYISRKDWDTGVDIRGYDPVCAKPERIAFDRPVPFSERHGFWQIQYRGVDRAGNASAWSEPVVLLLEQIGVRQAIVNRAVAQQSELDKRSFYGTPNAMLTGLEVYRSWKNLTTVYERETLENSILLTLHRPWFLSTVQQVMRVIPSTDIPRRAFPVMNGRKLVSVELVARATGGHDFKVVLQDTETYQEEILPTPEFLPDGWGSSRNGQYFFYFDSFHLFYFSLKDGHLKPQTIPSKERIRSVRFLKEDAELVMATNDNVLHFYSVEEELKNPLTKSWLLKTNDFNNIPTVFNLADDAQGIWLEDFDQNNLIYWSLFEENVRRPSTFESQKIPTLRTGSNRDTVRPLDSDTKFFVSLGSDHSPHCSYYSFDSTRPDSQKAVMELESMPCGATESGTPLNSSIWMEGEDNLAAVVYKPGVDNLRKSILQVGEPKWDLSAFETYVTPDGKWMFNSNTWMEEDDSEEIGTVRMLERDENGVYVPFKKFKACPFLQAFGFQYDPVHQLLVHGCYWQGMDIYVWDLSTDEPTMTEHVRPDYNIGSFLLIKDQLYLGSDAGEVLLYRLSDRGKVTFQTILKLGIGWFMGLMYDDVAHRLYTVEAQGSESIKVWDMNDLTKPLQSMTGIGRYAHRADLSYNRRYLAVASQDNPRMKVVDLQNPSSSLEFADHQKGINGFSFIGDSSLIATGSGDGEVRIWDIKNPDMPAIAFHPGGATRIVNIEGIPGKNEFTVESTLSRIEHYKLETMDEIVLRTCENLRAYLHYTASSFPEQAALCAELGKR